MILCYQGSPGSGKTYDAVNRVIENLKRGRVVYTNIDGLDDSLNREVIKVLTNLDDFELSKRLVYLTSDQICCFWKHVKSGSMIVIDEIFVLFLFKGYGHVRADHQAHIAADAIAATEAAFRLLFRLEAGKPAVNFFEPSRSPLHRKSRNPRPGRRREVIEVNLFEPDHFR